MQVAFGAIEKSDHRNVDVPVFVGVCCSDASLGPFRVHTATWSAPTALPDELGPGRRRRKVPTDSVLRDAGSEITGAIQKEGSVVNEPNRSPHEHLKQTRLRGIDLLVSRLTCLRANGKLW